MFMRLGAPHKIDRYANRCSLYPPQAAVAYVARQRKALFCENFLLIKSVGTGLAPVRKKFDVNSNPRTNARVVPTV
ncbi:MAG: hypothetical protein PUG69_04675 [Ruminococcus sp.]|nr:hypothetical protein [Ruminococcus sp.]